MSARAAGMDLESYIVDALEQFQEEIDVSAYKVTREEAFAVFFQILNRAAGNNLNHSGFLPSISWFLSQSLLQPVPLHCSGTRTAEGISMNILKSGKGSYKKIKTITKGKTISFLKSKLKKGTSYQFRVRAYKELKGKNYYGSYSKVKTVKIRKK